MRIEDFDYDLPAELIAQEPCAERDRARLLVMRRSPAGGPAVLAHQVVADLPRLLSPGDLLVLNDTRVVPARVLGRRARTEGRWEGLYIRSLPDGTWELMCQTRGRLIVGETLLVDPPARSGAEGLRLCLVGRNPAGRWLARPAPATPTSDEDLLARYGQVPLPPYIRKGRAGPADRDRYQTVFASRPGAVAAPTAGLHFTPALFQALTQRDVRHAFVTLHVGPGTFQPVQTEDVSLHRTEPEWGELPPATAEAIAATKARGGRIIAVGTTSVRVLETAARASPEGISAWSGITDLTIAPPWTFQAVDALLTNFHLPRSSLLLLVSAFAGVDAIRDAYRIAVEQRYRFYSYGDAMLIL